MARLSMKMFDQVLSKDLGLAVTDKVEFEAALYGRILQIIGSNTDFTDFSRGLESVNGGINQNTGFLNSVTFIKSVGSRPLQRRGTQLRPLNGIDFATANAGSSFEQDTVFFSETIFNTYYIAFKSLQDQKGIGMFSTKVRENLWDLTEYRETAAYKALTMNYNGTVIGDIEKLYTGDTLSVDQRVNISARIRNQAIKLKNLVKRSGGIRRLSSEAIFIQINEQVYAGLLNSGAISDGETSLRIFMGGSEVVGMLHGFRIKSTPTIEPATNRFATFAAWNTATIASLDTDFGLHSKDFKKVYAIIGTDQTAVAPWRLDYLKTYKTQDFEDQVSITGMSLPADKDGNIVGSKIIYDDLCVVLTSNEIVT